jgi:Domain of unknown function (DUF1929)/Glyoxal oxidase N-terminus/PKD domain
MDDFVNVIGGNRGNVLMTTRLSDPMASRRIPLPARSFLAVIQSLATRRTSLVRAGIALLLGAFWGHFGGPETAMAQPGYVQGNSAVPQSNQTTVTLTYTSAQTAGDLNAVVVGWNETTAKVSTVTDSAGNVYTLAVGPTLLTGALSQSIYYAKNIKAAAAGGNVVTVKFTSAAAYPDIRILEYSGIDTASPLDVVSGKSGSSQTSATAAVTTTRTTDLLLGANIVQTGTNGPGANFTQRLLTGDGDIAEDRVVTANGSYSASAPLSPPSAGWVMQMVAFAASGGGGGGGTIPTVTVSAATNVTASTATLNGSISSNGSQTITSDGFDYGTTTSYGTHVAAPTVQSGAFSTNITGLTSGTTYHYRATAVNASGTGVSADSQFVFGAGNTGAQVTGQWQTLPYLMTINPIRLGLLHTGQIVIVAGSENNPTEHAAGTSVGALWDPNASTINIIPMLWDVFCNGGSFLADGRCMTFGGTAQYDPFYGDPRTTVFDPQTDLFNQLQSMADGRWYATAITLGNGQVMVFSGYGDTGAVNKTVELYTVGSGYSTPYTANWDPPLYPWLHLLPNGLVFYSGYSPVSWIYNPANPTANWTASASTLYGQNRTYGNSVLLPLLPANNYAPRVMILGGNSPATASTEIIDLSKSNPAWVSSGNMPSGARIEGNSVLLPTGKVLALGGSVMDEDASTATLGADLYDPVAGTWSSAGTCAYPRLYHSSALLLPNGTVVSAGSNPVRGTYEQHIESYSPAYLFTTDGNGNTIPATRPTITSSPTKIGYAGSFQVQTPNAATISSVVLMRNGSVTHAFDMDQRMVGLTFTVGSGVLTVTGPPTQNIAPPGYYMLFLVNNAGVPSIANFVQVLSSPTDQPPKGTITSPANNLTVSTNQAVNFAGTATNGGGTVASTQWIFPEGTPPTSPSLNAGSVLFSSPGTYVASLTAVDNLGVNDPSPPTRTITVSTATATIPSVSTANGATNVTATTATLNGSILSNGNQTITSDGFDYGTTTSYGTHVAATTVQSGAFSANITGLTSGTTYHYRATAVNASGTGVSPDSQFGGGGTTPAFVQGNSATPQAVQTTVSVPYNGAQTAGDLNVVVVGWNDTNVVVNSVTDSKGTVYKLAVGPTVLTNGGPLSQSIYYAPNIPAASAGANAVTVIFTAPAAYPDIRILEYSGLNQTNPLDVVASASGSSTTSSSGSLTTTAATDLLIGANMVETGTNGPSAGFTQRLLTSDGDIAEDEVVTSVGTYSASVTLSPPSAGWVMQLVAFHP